MAYLVELLQGLSLSDSAFTYSGHYNDPSMLDWRVHKVATYSIFQTAQQLTIVVRTAESAGFRINLDSWPGIELCVDEPGKLYAHYANSLLKVYSMNPQTGWLCYEEISNLFARLCLISQLVLQESDPDEAVHSREMY